jgi:hypothetical protein
MHCLKFGRFLSVWLLLNLALCLAQTQSPAGSNWQSTPPPQSTQENNKKEIKQEESQRMVGIVPQFGVTNRRNAPPLSSHEKFHLFRKSAFDPAEFALVGLQAGISQAQDEFPEYGQGAVGYGKRYGAAFADQVSSGFFSNYFYPVLLKEDPRYFRLGEGSTMHRIGYSLTQEFECRTDSGKRSFGWSNTLGSLTAGGISNAYYPQSDRGFGLTMSRAGIAMLYGSLGGLADEFYPDIDRKLIHRHPKQTH